MLWWLHFVFVMAGYVYFFTWDWVANPSPLPMVVLIPLGLYWVASALVVPMRHAEDDDDGLEEED